MLKTLMVAAAISCGTVSAQAGDASHPRIDIFDRPSYDRKLELAVKRIVARRIGTIRGGLEKDLGPLLVAQANESLSFNQIARSLVGQGPLPTPTIYASITH